MIRTKNLCKIYGKGDGSVKALDNVSLDIKDGEMVAITGKSGSGKTTLLNLLGGLDTASNGDIFYDSKNITKFNDKKLADFRLNTIGFVFQFFDLIPELTVEENILLPTKLAHNRNSKIKELLSQLGMAERKKHYPSQISGGQQQRAAIIRALINDPDVLLCDEPTGNLDVKSGNEVIDLLDELSKKHHKTIIIVTHDMQVAERCDRIMTISDGRIVV